MKNTEKAYIEIELGTSTWNVDLEHNGMQDILDEGIDCYEDDVYHIIYQGYDITEEKLKELLDDKDNSMLYPLDCFNDLSYENWLEYKKEQEFWEKEKRIDRNKKIQKTIYGV
jgi:hypothetical protein